MKRLRVSLVLSLAVAFAGCETPADPGVAVQVPNLGVVAQGTERTVVFDADLFATNLQRVVNDNEVLVWLKDESEARVSATALLNSGGHGPVLLAQRAPNGGERQRASLTRSRGAVAAGGLEAALVALGTEIYLKGVAIPFMALRIPEKTLPAVTRLLLEHPNVDWIEANRRRVARTQAGTLGSNPTSGNHAAHWVTGAWDHTRGSGAKIGVLDTGFGGIPGTSTWHPDGQDYVSYGVKKLGFVDDGGGCNSSQQSSGLCLAHDDNGHGTRMTGLIAANDNNQYAVGIAPLALTYSMKVAFNADRPDLSCPWPGWWDDRFCLEDDDLVEALEWASYNGLDVLSMSFVATLGTSAVAALSYAYNTYDVLLLGGLGNDSGDPSDLVELAWVMGVGGVSSDSVITYAENIEYWEIGGFSGGRTLAADCTDLDAICTLNYPYDMEYGTYGGSSAATANVAAVAGLLRAAVPGLTNAQARSRLLYTASGALHNVADAEWAVENVTGVWVGIDGPTELNDNENHTWSALAGGGVGGYTYVWDRKVTGGSWYTVSTGSTYVLSVLEGDPDFELRVTVTSAGRRARNQLSVAVCIPDVCEW